MINFVLFVDLQSPSVTPRKPLQSDNTSHSQEEDSYSVTSSYPFQIWIKLNSLVDLIGLFV